MSSAIAITAPAKLNLGLEILGRRLDGYHEIVTIFQTISLQDDLRLAPGKAITFSGEDPTGTGEANLALRALVALRDAASATAGATLSLRKRIPIAAGLGGASSDAAAALLAARVLWELNLADPALATFGARLGSDVPFFLTGGTALGSGRGEVVSPLPPLSGLWFVLVVPDVAIPRKTPTLYAALEDRDFSDGGAVAALTAPLRAGDAGGPLLGAMPNAFRRALYALRPDLASLPVVMRAAGAPHVAISGAGPTHFTVTADPEAAAALADRLRAALGAAATVIVATPVPGLPIPRPD